jgi:hypothetical protein
MPVIAVLAASALLALSSCSSSGGSDDEDDGGGANATRIVNGTIAVANASYWSYIKIGTFSGNTNGSYPKLDIENNNTMVGTRGIGDYRIIYKDTFSGADVPVSRVAGTEASISGSSNARSYSYELPAALPGADVLYYYCAWYDGNSNGVLDLKDASPTTDETTVVQGEYNRCATKASIDPDDQPTTLVVWGFAQDKDQNGNLTGNYKYKGYDVNVYNEMQALDTSNNSGFDFNIAANSGW